MKVIDLLNKIANGDETIKKIKYDNQIFEYREDMLDYYCYDYDLNLMGYQKCLNDEVEIIEEKPRTLNDIRESYGLPRIEKKEIEKLDIYNCFHIMGDNEVSRLRLDDNFQNISDKINEIIDAINNN